MAFVAVAVVEDDGTAFEAWNSFCQGGNQALVQRDPREPLLRLLPILSVQSKTMRKCIKKDSKYTCSPAAVRLRFPS